MLTLKDCLLNAFKLHKMPPDLSNESASMLVCGYFDYTEYRLLSKAPRNTSMASKEIVI